MNIPKSISVIRRVGASKNLLGLTDRKSKPYVIGFIDKSLALHVSKNITIDPNCYILRGITHDISDDVNSGLKSMGINEIIDDICIDVNAKLTIMKKPESDPVKTDFFIETMDYGVFMMYPFEKMVGVILPNFIMDEDDHKMEFESQVIDPSDNLKRAAMNLDDLFKGT
jgi:CRISPR/Cas system-associated protein Csx1